MDLLFELFNKFKKSLRETNKALSKQKQFQEKLKLVTARGGKDLLLSKESRNVSKLVEDSANQLSKDTIQLYTDLQLFFTLFLIDRSKIHWSMSYERFKDDMDEETREGAKECYHEHKLISGLSLSHLVKRFDENPKYNKLIYLKRNFYAFTSFRNVLAHTDLSRMIYNMDKNMINILISIVDEIMDDIITINDELPNIHYQKYNDTLTKQFLEEDKKNLKGYNNRVLDNVRIIGY
jgi:hypothetical protein